MRKAADPPRSQQLVETAGTDGRFTFTTAPGQWQLSVLRDSFPAGYSITPASGEPRTMMLDRAEALNVDVAMIAHRMIPGRAAPNAEILVQPLDVQPLDRRVQADA